VSLSAAQVNQGSSERWPRILPRQDIDAAADGSIAISSSRFGRGKRLDKISFVCRRCRAQRFRLRCGSDHLGEAPPLKMQWFRRVYEKFRDQADMVARIARAASSGPIRDVSMVMSGLGNCRETRRKIGSQLPQQSDRTSHLKNSANTSAGIFTAWIQNGLFLCTKLRNSASQ
jgi:hypothetical protein